MTDLLKELAKPFHPSQVSWKPGATKGDRAMAMPYADLRTYMNRLDEVCGLAWSIKYEPWGADRIIACLTIDGVTRCSTGEMAAQDEKNEIGGTVAEAQAAKRACAMFGLGRYLYQLPTGWADIDPSTKKFTDKAKARLTGILVQHYRRATDGKVDALDDAPAPQEAHSDDSGANVANVATEHEYQRLDDTGRQYYGEKWPAAATKWVLWASDNRTDDIRRLTSDETENIVQGIMKRIEKAIGNAESEAA